MLIIKLKEVIHRNVVFHGHKLFDILQSLDIGSLDISDYAKNYLCSHIRALERTLQKYSYVLTWWVAFRTGNAKIESKRYHEILTLDCSFLR